MSEDVKERYGARLEDEETDDQEDTSAESVEPAELAEAEQAEEPIESEQDEEPKENDTNDQSEWDVDNVKNAWNANTILLPESLDERFDDEYGRLNWQTDGDFKKDRHFKPLVVYLGLEQLADQEGEDVTELLERMERKE